MLNALVRFSIRFRGIVVALACTLAGYGVYALLQSQQDVFPEFSPPMAVIQTEAPGLSSEQVETLVTQPVENALGGAIGLRSMKSTSLSGLSVVTLVFDEHTDIYRARQLAGERLGGLAAELPAGVEAPSLLPLTSSTGVVMMVGLTSRTRSLMDVHDVAQWIVRPHLLGLPGIADAIVFGGETREFQVQVDPDRLARAGLSLQDVLDAARGATGVRGAGFLENANQRIAIATEGQAATAAALAGTVIRMRDGVAVRLGDVATVRDAPAPAVGAASIGERDGVMMVIEGQYGADTLALTAAIDRALAALRPALEKEGVDLAADVFRPADFIQVVVGHLRNALLVGGAMVLAVLFLFLYNVRTACISAVAIPLSLLATVIALHHFGISLNAMTLGGLAIALGEVVDDAVVDVENMFRRLRENRAAAQPKPWGQVILDASLEVRGAVVYATFIVALVFSPVLALSGVAGKLFAPLGIAYIFAILASLGVALTVTPALTAILLPGGALNLREPRLVMALKDRYARALVAVERHSTAAIWIIVLLCAAAAACLPFLSATFIPELKEGHYTVHMSVAPGTSLQESMRVGHAMTRELERIPGVRLVGQRAGRAAEMVDPTGVNNSEIEVELKPMSGDEQTRVLDRIREVIAGYPGLTTSVNTVLTERIDETISGFTAPVIVTLYGNDLDLLDGQAQRVAQVLGSVPGAVGVAVQSPPGTLRLSVRLRPERLAQYGFAPVEVMDAVRTAFHGVRAAQVYDGSRVRDVTVILAPDERRSPADVGRLPVRNAQGVTVPLSRLATIEQVAGRYQIRHSAGQRVQTVTCGVRGRAVGDFVRDAQQRIRAGVEFPRGTYFTMSGEAQAQARSQRELLVNTALAVAGIGLLLFMALRTARGALLVLFNLPFALVGGVTAAVLTGAALSLGSLIGFVTLFGITLRNAIMLVSHYEHLIEREGCEWGPETALRGASERLVPILMTALVTALGLLPLAWNNGEPGNEIEGPMAIVILGGLVTSTLLNLLILPALSLRFGRFGARREDPFAGVPGG